MKAEEARKLIAEQLRALANQVESMPEIAGFELTWRGLDDVTMNLMIQPPVAAPFIPLSFVVPPK